MSQLNDLPANPGRSSIQEILQKLENAGDESIGIKSICLHDLLLTDPEHDREEHLDVKGRVTEGTCNWILGTREYTQWHQRNLESSNILWICGGPGSGKTTLSIFLSKHLEHTINTRGTARHHLTEEGSVLYFNCNGSDIAKNSETGILRGLLFQAIRQRPWLLGHVQQIYENQRNDLSQSWSFDALWTALRSSILSQSANHVPRFEVEETTNHQNEVAYIVLDGLDECEPTSIRRLISRLSRLDEDKELGEKVKVIITSRERPDLRDAFTGRRLQLNLGESLNAEAVRADVQKHIVQQLGVISHPDSKRYSAELCTSIHDYLTQNSQGNFLWVSMAITELKSTSRIEAWEHLSRLPPTLDAMYEWLVMQIPHNWRELATRVLLWVTLASRPLSIAELVAALDETRLGLVNHETIRHCISRCGQILRIYAGDTVQLIHHGAWEYLWGRLESSPSFFKDCVELNPFSLKEGHGHYHVQYKDSNGSFGLREGFLDGAYEECRRTDARYSRQQSSAFRRAVTNSRHTRVRGLERHVDRGHLCAPLRSLSWINAPCCEAPQKRFEKQAQGTAPGGAKRRSWSHCVASGRTSPRQFSHRKAIV